MVEVSGDDHSFLRLTRKHSDHVLTRGRSGTENGIGPDLSLERETRNRLVGAMQFEERLRGMTRAREEQVGILCIHGN